MPPYGIDGKILHLKELGFIEKVLFEQVLSPDDFYKELTSLIKANKLGETETFAQSDLEKIDMFVKNYFNQRISEAKTWLLRAYILGRLLGNSDLKGTIFKIDPLAALPKYIQDAAKQYGLTVEEAMAMQNAMEESAGLLSNTTIETIKTVRNVLVENIKKGGDSKSLYDTIRETVKNDAGEINRNWATVIATETSTIFNNGYISMMSEGDFVVGVSMPDACDSCLEEINGKVYRVRKEPAPDYSNMKGEEYEKWAEVWENYIWVGKNNYGRSASKRKRINPLLGNKDENLRAKHHHEHSMPSIPMHPICHCVWVHINPKYQWVDEHGKLKMRVEDEDKWQPWYDEEIKERFLE